MRAWHQPPGLLVGNYLAHRTVATQPNDRYPRHGDNMD